MKRVFAILFGILLLLSVLVWIAGTLTAAVVPWFGGMRVERIGQAGVTIFLCGEGFVYLFGWLFKVCSNSPRQAGLGLPGAKKYGNKKPGA